MNVIVSQRWYREPWVWFNLLLLSAAILAASVMSIVAVQHTPAEIGSRWYQDGVLAKREKHQEALVRQMHLRGQLKMTAAGEMQLTLEHDAIAANGSALDGTAVLQLYIEHPTTPEADQVITLKRVKPLHYVGQVQAPLQGKRRLMVTPGDDRWYLTSEAYFPVAQLTFTPELG